jgi:hypothetical protein
MEEGRIHPNYQGMMEIRRQPRAENAVSETQAQLMGLDEGARWSHEAFQRDYTRGGNEGEFTELALNANGEPVPWDVEG